MRCVNNYYCNDCRYQIDDPKAGRYCRLKLEQDGYAITENLVILEK